MTQFTPVSATIGGALIGLSASWLWLALGHVAGISGILGAITRAEAGWRVAFLVGLIGAPMLFGLLGGSVPWHAPDGSWPVLVAGGLLVGFGTQLGSGCTSGHGVCGLARLSPRSLAATLTFMLTGGLVVFALRHGWGG
jgi:uncharacterized membrane protein YedE/YeeE